MYRIVSPTAILGYGFPESSLNNAANKPIDLIACDAGSMDAGPYYLGSGQVYVEKAAIKRDLTLILRTTLKYGCPLIVGNAGFAGNSSHLEEFLTVIREIFVELQNKPLKIAVIDSTISHEILNGYIDSLEPLGKMPPLNLDKVADSSLVGQMGIAPYIAALDAGAQIIISGRACDIAIFAADPIRRGIDPGLAYHAGHVLECGAIACLPGSGSDCLIAEFLDDGKTVIFPSPNPERITTARSVAAHSLYEESHPSFQHYPEGTLDLRETEYFQYTPEIAGIRKSKFINRSLSIKIEGAAKAGTRIVSFLPCDQETPLSNEYTIYGKNGVEVLQLTNDVNEMAIIVEISGKDQAEVETLSSIYKAGLLHFGYPGRRTTAGNLAYPMSPSTINFINSKDEKVAIFLGGTREPGFINNINSIFQQIEERVKRDYPELIPNNNVKLHTYDKNNPLIFIDTVAKNNKEAKIAHNKILEKIRPYRKIADQVQYEALSAGYLYDWCVFHITKNREFIKQLFPVKVYKVNNNVWEMQSTCFPREISIGQEKIPQINENKIDLIEEIPHNNKIKNYKYLPELASIIRSKDAGVNTITYDIFFNDEKSYQQAIKSNMFTRKQIAILLNLPENDVIGAFKADSCLAIKVSRYRRVISGSHGTRDVFGAQQHLPFTKIKIPME